MAHARKHARHAAGQWQIYGLIAVSLVLLGAIFAYSRSRASAEYDPMVDANRTYTEKTKQLESWNKDLAKYTQKYPNVQSNASTLLGNYKDFLSKGKICIDAADANCFWEVNGDMDSLWSDVDEAFKTYKNEDEWKNILTNCKSQTREITKDMPSSMKSLSKDLTRTLKSLPPEEQAKVQTYLADLDAKYAAVKAALSRTDSYCVNKQGSPFDYHGDVGRDLDDAKRDYYDVQQQGYELQNSGNCKDNFARNIKGKDKNVDSQYKQLVKKLKGEPVPADVETAYQGYVNAYAQAEQTYAGGNGDCQEAQNTLNEANAFQQDFWNSTQGVNEQEREKEDVKRNEMNLKQVLQELTRREKELIRMKSSLKRSKKAYERAVKKFADKEDRKEKIAEYAALVGELETLINSGDAIFAQVKEAAAENPDDSWSEMEELNDFQNQVNDLSNKVQAISDVMREVKKVESDIKRREKELARFKDSELRAALQELIGQAKSTLQEGVWNNLITDPFAARESLNSVYELSRDWDETIQDWEDQEFDKVEEEESLR